MNNGELRSGMTLVELTVAIALGAMLMAALVGVTKRVSLNAQRAEAYDKPVWPNRVGELMRRDLAAAESLWMANGELSMYSEPPSYHGSGVGVRLIQYKVGSTPGGNSVLLRIDDGRRECLAIGTARIVLERLDVGGSPQPLPQSAGPVPTQVRVWFFDHDSAIIHSQDLVVR